MTWEVKDMCSNLYKNQSNIIIRPMCIKIGQDIFYFFPILPPKFMTTISLQGQVSFYDNEKTIIFESKNVPLHT
ncbi:hypothetical protein PBAL39_09276 [Pedobacter sp. BAL39]|nr:hypothetical protein PBAL39_09276 [Pedobacter sp. BAL39]